MNIELVEDEFVSRDIRIVRLLCTTGVCVRAGDAQREVCYEESRVGMVDVAAIAWRWAVRRLSSLFRLGKIGFGVEGRNYAQLDLLSM